MSLVKKLKISRSFFIFIIILFSFFLYSYRLTSAYYFDSDMARDLNEILDLTQGKFKLLGPSSSFGGLYTGPYYYYLFTPILLLTRFNLDSILLLNAFFFSLALGYFFYQVYAKHDLFKAALSTTCLVLFPLLIFAARNPGNAFTYLPFLLFFLTCLVFADYEKKSVLFSLGILAGVILNFHY